MRAESSKSFERLLIATNRLSFTFIFEKSLAVKVLYLSVNIFPIDRNEIILNGKLIKMKLVLNVIRTIFQIGTRSVLIFWTRFIFFDYKHRFFFQTSTVPVIRIVNVWPRWTKITIVVIDRGKNTWCKFVFAKNGKPPSERATTWKLTIITENRQRPPTVVSPA